MKLNCKPGDLAVVIGARKTIELNGRIVKIGCAAIDGESFGRYLLKSPIGYSWTCESIGDWLLPWRMNSGDLVMLKTRPIADKFLRPIRPSEEQDEMLRIVGLPNKETV